MNNHKRAKNSGAGTIAMLGIIVLSLIFSAMAVDFGFYYTAQNHLQSAADASALAATQELWNNAGPDPADRQDDAKSQAIQLVAEYALDGATLTIDPTTDVQFGYVDPITKIFNSTTFPTASTDPNYTATGGYNAVRVTVRKEAGINGQLPTIMARLLNRQGMDVQATSVAMMDDTFGAVNPSSGLVPFYACLAQFQIADEDTVPENNIIRMFGPNFTVDGVNVNAQCPSNGSGNWGFADFRDGDPGAPSNQTIADWIMGGFDGEVLTDPDVYYSTQPGAAIASNEVRNAIQYLIDNEIEVTVPLLDMASGNGSNTEYHIAGLAGFVFTDFKWNGNSSQRYVEGYFTRINNNNANAGQVQGAAVVRLRLVH